MRQDTIKVAEMGKARLSDLLAELREARGWDLGELSVRSGIDRKSLRTYERGSAMPEVPNLQKLARAYGFSASDLLSEIGL